MEIEYSKSAAKAISGMERSVKQNLKRTMVDILPEQEQMLAFEFLKRMVLAWDPDYVKSTPSEIEAMELGNNEIERGETVAHALVDWS